VISPRSYDADAGAGTYPNFTKRSEYDLADRLTRSQLPFDGRDGTERRYTYVAYDKNNRQICTSLPTTATTAAAVTGSAKTAQTYFDPGWVRTLGKTVNPSLRFDYDAMGMQTYRVPDKAGQPGVPDLDNEMSWTYFVDGQKKSMTDRDGNTATWRYDEHNQVVYSFDPTGVHGADDTGFDEIAKARYRKDQASRPVGRAKQRAKPPDKELAEPRARTASLTRRGCHRVCWAAAARCISTGPTRLSTTPCPPTRRSPRGWKNLSPVRQSVSRLGGRSTPQGWTWHHAPTAGAQGRTGVMQLVPSAQHSPGRRGGTSCIRKVSVGTPSGPSRRAHRRTDPSLEGAST
jgi:hypothetical protein